MSEFLRVLNLVADALLLIGLGVLGIGIWRGGREVKKAVRR